MAKALIAFYSRADENYVSGMLKMLDVGNTEVAARMIKELTGAELLQSGRSSPIQKVIMNASPRRRRTRNGRPAPN